MSEGEVNQLRKMIAELSAKTDRQHQENQTALAEDREAFSKALTSQQMTFTQEMGQQRQAFQEALNKQFLMHMQLENKVAAVDTKLTLVVGAGQPGEGRLGMLEETVETLKKFRWQALTVITAMLYLTEKVVPLFVKH